MGDTVMLRALTYPIRAAYAVSIGLVMMLLKAAIGITLLGAVLVALFYWQGR